MSELWHRPRRGSDVELYLRNAREVYVTDSISWDILDILLNDYRLRSDYGLSLSESVEGYK